ncbi:MAG: uroporphyrinogen-III synthase, partial [Thermomicrobiaceae bacterium]|nr:uroporphyrinogen-III synthase [Thermomicrobiaceae bacterium]
RARGQADSLSDLLHAAGATPVPLPAIEIVPPADLGPLDAAARDLERYDWVVFTSANGVDALVARLDALGRGADAFSHSRIAAIGAATAERLRAHGLRADLVPPRYVAEEVLAALVAHGVAGRRVLLPRAEVARDILPAGLRAAGAEVDVVVAYRTRQPAPDPEALRLLEAGAIDVVTLTSSSTARNLVALLGGRVDLVNRAFVACIGPITADTARECGLRVDLVAEEYSIPGLVAALASALGAPRATHERSQG